MSVLPPRPASDAQLAAHFLERRFRNAERLGRFGEEHVEPCRELLVGEQGGGAQLEGLARDETHMARCLTLLFAATGAAVSDRFDLAHVGVGAVYVADGAVGMHTRTAATAAAAVARAVAPAA